MGQLSTKLESKHMLHIYKRLYKTVSAGRQLGWVFFCYSLVTNMVLYSLDS